MFNLILMMVGILTLIGGLLIVRQFRNVIQLLGLLMVFVGFTIAIYNLLLVLTYGL